MKLKPFPFWTWGKAPLYLPKRTPGAFGKSIRRHKEAGTYTPRIARALAGKV